MTPLFFAGMSPATLFDKSLVEAVLNQERWLMQYLFLASTDPSDPSLRKTDDAFLVGPILVSAW